MSPCFSEPGQPSADSKLPSALPATRGTVEKEWCTISGSAVAAEAASARAYASCSFLPSSAQSALSRTFSPTTISRFSSMHSTACLVLTWLSESSMSSTSSSSSTTTTTTTTTTTSSSSSSTSSTSSTSTTITTRTWLSESSSPPVPPPEQPADASPCIETFSRASTRVLTCFTQNSGGGFVSSSNSITTSTRRVPRKPGIVVAPASPASTTVVTPRPRQYLSAGTPRGVQR